MQSYQLHIVSQQLKKRHPYLQAPFKARYDSTEVYKSIFDRTIPKLIEILLMQNIPIQRYTNALITLSQIASDQIQKSNMIQQGIIGIASAYLHCKIISIRRQAIILLGLLLSTNHGIGKLTSQAFQGFKKLLFDEILQIRIAVVWSLCRISISRLGTQILCNEKITPIIIQSFLKYSSNEYTFQQQYVIIYLLQCFLHLFAYDIGIISALNTGLTNQLKILTSTQKYSKQNNIRIHYLSLGVLNNIAMNNQGKCQCVKQEIIIQTQCFLQSNVPQLIANQVTLIMFIANDLNGKKQCIYNKNGEIQTKIVYKLIELLNKPSNLVNEIVKNNVKQAIKIISQQYDAFTTIVQYMCKQNLIPDLQQIFNQKVIIPLSSLLPSQNDLIEPPILPSNKINSYKLYVKTINYFINSSNKQCILIALKQCVDLCIKLIMFICYKGDKILQQGSIKSIISLIQSHQYSLESLKEFLNKYQNVQHKITKTTLKKQIQSFKELKEILQGNKL